MANLSVDILNCIFVNLSCKDAFVSAARTCKKWASVAKTSLPNKRIYAQSLIHPFLPPCFGLPPPMNWDALITHLCVSPCPATPAEVCVLL
jgi:hypothetical protein